MSEAENMHLARPVPEQKNNPVIDTFATSVKAGQCSLRPCSAWSTCRNAIPVSSLFFHLTAQAWGLCTHPNTSGHQASLQKRLDEARTFSKPQGKQSRMEAGVEKETVYLYVRAKPYQNKSMFTVVQHCPNVDPRDFTNPSQTGSPDPHFP